MTLAVPAETPAMAAAPAGGRERRRWARRALVAGGLALALGAVAALPDLDGLNRRGIDFLLPLRHLAFGPLFTPAQSDAVVVAVDEQTYRSEPFSGTPKVAWTPHLAQVLDGPVAAGATVVGFDMIYPTSLDRPELLRGYDRPFLLSLRQAAEQGKVVLGQARLSGETIAPYPGQLLAAKGPDNLRTLNLKLDDDDVVRRYWRDFKDERGGSAPSFGVELAMRAGAPMPADDFLINFNTGAGDVPVHSLADLFACTGKGDAVYMERHFKGKIVLLGEALDLEDRFRSAKRFAHDEAADARAAPERCALAADPGRFAPVVDRRSMPGVLIHAAAVNTLTKGLALEMLPRGWTFVTVAGSLFLLGLLFFALSPALGLLAWAGVAAAQGVVSVAALQAGWVAPMPSFAILGALTFTLLYAYRFVVEDRERRRIHHAFRHYLAPALVDRLAEDPSALKLGGERRHMTVMFSDIVGFTSISEGLKDRPERLVELMNRYLTFMSEVVERHGGYVDKFIGDAVMAVWGAPLPTDRAEIKAVETALDCQAALERFNAEVVVGEYGMPALGTRIGIATGYAIAGNMGSSSRLNYTVTGDMVNLASRLEGANKEYGSLVMVSEATASALGDRYVLRRLDRLVVKGKTEPIAVFEVVGRAGEVPLETLRRLAAFESALALHDIRRFAEARYAFEGIAGDDTSALYAKRCAFYLDNPPPTDWNGAFVMTSK